MSPAPERDGPGTQAPDPGVWFFSFGNRVGDKIPLTTWECRGRNALRETSDGDAGLRGG
ncbi:hypothetical protein NITHO_1160014 [Nitrolancea hollandica Lb]|uniref:Uncharacterized protein n=1 Tax=Nitrolancea hollandica Lb TaxID=1129897 RepID=I4ECQ5_9BACT|nr:hypothetical protein NITHO_1160014 [Nitrolancea hollandica Lb]